VEDELRVGRRRRPGRVRLKLAAEDRPAVEVLVEQGLLRWGHYGPRSGTVHLTSRGRDALEELLEADAVRRAVETGGSDR